MRRKCSVWERKDKTMNKKSRVSRIKKYPVVVFLIAALVLGLGIAPMSPEKSTAKKKKTLSITLISGEFIDFGRCVSDGVSGVESSNQNVIGVSVKDEYVEGVKSIISFTLTAGTPGSSTVTIHTKGNKKTKVNFKVVESKGIHVTVYKVNDRGEDYKYENLRYEVLYKVENQEDMFIESVSISGSFVGARDTMSVRELPSKSSVYCWFYSGEAPTEEKLQNVEYKYRRDFFKNFKNMTDKLQVTLDGAKIRIKNKSKKAIDFNFQLLYGDEENSLEHLYEPSVYAKQIGKKKTQTITVRELYTSDKPYKPYEFLGIRAFEAEASGPINLSKVSKIPGLGMGPYNYTYNKTAGYPEEDIRY